MLEKKVFERLHSGFVRALSTHPSVQRFELMLPSVESDYCPPRGVFQRILIAPILSGQGEAQYIAFIACDSQMNLNALDEYLLRQLIERNAHSGQRVDLYFLEKTAKIWDQKIGLPEGLPKIKQLLWNGARIDRGTAYFGFATLV